MSDHDDPQYRTRHEADPDHVEVREEDGDGLFRIRMPVTSTAEARDGVAFDRDRLEGWTRQIETGGVGVFLDHGRNETTGSRYSALGKVGYWDAPALEERDGVTDLMADAVIADPSAMGDDVGEIREALAWLKTQAELGIPLSSSVGWSDDTGDRELPGDSDLLEISIVGIPSDPRTSTASAEPAAMARAVSAASSDFDVQTFIRAVEALQDGGRAEYEVGDTTVDITPPDAVANAATVALAKDDELEPDCGTGAGRQSAQAIASDDVGPERIDDIAAYLTSHEEDVTADGPPSDWSDEEWQDCGNLQYALWGGTGTGTGLEWAQQTANEVADAKGEELPYPERNSMSNDDTEPDEESGTDTDEQHEERMDMEEAMSEMVELQREQTEMLREMYKDREDGMDDSEDSEDSDGEDEEDDMEESSTDADDERRVTLDGEEMPVEDARDQIAELREEAEEAEPAESQTRNHGDEADAVDEENSDDNTAGGFGLAGISE